MYPDLTPLEALSILKGRESFSFGSFIYKMDIDEVGVDAECTETGILFVTCGGHGTEVTKYSEWNEF